MEVLILLLFVSLMLVVCAVGFFAWTLHNRNHQHLDRLCLLPLDDRAELRSATDSSAGTGRERRRATGAGTTER